MADNLGSYSSIRIDLTTAREMEVGQICDRIHFLRAEAAGVLDLDALIEVKLTDGTNSDWLPLSVNNGVKGPVSRFRIRWAAQPGKIAWVFISLGNYEVSAPPTKQLVTASVGTTVAAAAVVVGVAAVVLAASSGSRQSVTIQNKGAAAIYIGPAGVTMASGIEVASNGSITIDHTTAALYGISGTAGQDVRVLTEA